MGVVMVVVEVKVVVEVVVEDAVEGVVEGAVEVRVNAVADEVVVVVADVGPPPVFDSAPLWCRNRSTLVAAMQISVVVSLPWRILAA